MCCVDVTCASAGKNAAVFTLVTASAILTGPFLDAYQLGVRLHFDVDVKILRNFDVDGTNVKTAYEM